MQRLSGVSRGLRACCLGAFWLLIAQTAWAQPLPPRILSWVEVIPGPQGSPIRWPVAVAAALDGEIAVADAFDSRVLVFTRVGASWQLEHTVELPAVPVGLTHDGSGFVAALRGPSSLVALDGSGGSLRELPLPAGFVPGAIAATPDGSLLVFDAGSRQVLGISAVGAVERTIDIGHHVTALAIGHSGGFFAVVPHPAMVVAVDANGALRATWSLEGEDPTPAWPMGIAVAPGGDLFVTDRHSGRIMVLDATGRWVGLGSRGGWDAGLLRFPGSLARLPNGDLLVADQGNNRVQVFRRSDRSGDQ